MSEIRATTISDAAGTGPITLTGQSAAKAWVNFDGTGTIATRDSLNVSSLTDNGTGNYTVSFSNSMNNANYSPTFAGGPYTSDNNRNISSIYDAATSLVKIGTWSSGGTKEDYVLVSSHIHGDLA